MLHWRNPPYPKNSAYPMFFFFLLGWLSISSILLIAIAIAKTRKNPEVFHTEPAAAAHRAMLYAKAISKASSTLRV